MRHFRVLNLFILLTIVSAMTPQLCAQQFSVVSFKVLPNDVSAFINPVRDLNDDDCGLIKVIGSDDFVFSTPLGVVKRVDNVGEIWLYLPRGSKKITIKHAEWGVLRDYVFPTRIDSHMTYELRIDEPHKPIAAPEPVTPVVTTITDTLVVTRVDTVVIRPVKKIVPFDLEALATVGFGGKSKDVLGGVMLMALKRHGGFVHAATNFGRLGTTIGDCDRHGEIGGTIPFYSGHTRHSALMLNAGAVHRLSDRVKIFEGLGYSQCSVGWELAPSEGGGYVKNTYYSTSGISFEAGAVLTFNRVSVVAAAATIKGTQWYGTIGVGIRIGK